MRGEKSPLTFFNSIVLKVSRKKIPFRKMIVPGLPPCESHFTITELNNINDIRRIDEFDFSYDPTKAQMLFILSFLLKEPNEVQNPEYDNRLGIGIVFLENDKQFKFEKTPLTFDDIETWRKQMFDWSTQINSGLDSLIFTIPLIKFLDYCKEKEYNFEFLKSLMLKLELDFVVPVIKDFVLTNIFNGFKLSIVETVEETE